jgi:hypothetical protein
MYCRENDYPKWLTIRTDKYEKYMNFKMACNLELMDL